MKTMPMAHIFLALLVAVVWGLNFIFLSLGLQEFPPLFLCALRFLLASLPVIIFVKPPAVSFKLVVAYGLIMFALQFAFLFMGLHVGMTPGMASLIVQVQIFFSMGFAAVFLKEKPTVWQILGALCAFSGIGLVVFHLDNTISLLGFICILCAAATWGVGNLITKKASHANVFSLVVWGAFVACFPMLLLSLVFEGRAQIIQSLHQMSWTGGLSLFYIVCISTWVGYGVWGFLMARYPVGLIVPFTLLVPVVGIICSVLFLNEPFFLWKLISGLLVIGGLYINLLSARFARWAMSSYHISILSSHSRT